MTYDLQQCSNTGNWWIIRQDADGYREILRTLSADLTVVQAHRYMDAYIADVNNGLQEYYMSNVLEFPSNTVAGDALRNSLVRQIDDLEDIYDILDALHGKMHDLEKQANEMEYTYDKELSRYADKVGSENVEVQFLGYTSRHIVSVDADGENFTLIIQEELLNED